MGEAPVVVTVTDLRRDAARLIAQMERSHAPLFVTQRGYVTAVVLSREEYATMCVLRDKGMQAVNPRLIVSGSPHPREFDAEEPDYWED